MAYFRRVGSDVVLIPEPAYVVGKGYGAIRSGGYAAFHAKPSKAFWRGSTTGAAGLTVGGLLRLPRYRLCLLSLQRPDLLDAKLTAVVQARSKTDDLEIVDHLARQGSAGPRVPRQHMFDCKVIVHIDGNSNSWGFIEKAMSGSCIVKVQSPWEQWFYDQIKPWVHYVPVAEDLSDLIEVLSTLLLDEALMFKIATEAGAWARSLNYEGEMARAAERLKQRFLPRGPGVADDLHAPALARRSDDNLPKSL